MTELNEPTTPVDDDELPKHIVRLLMTVRAESESDAVLMFIEELASKGVRNWVYATLDPETGVPTGEWNGYGADVLEEVRTIQRELAEAQLPEPTADTAQAEPESDQELLAQATQLNEQ